MSAPSNVPMWSATSNDFWRPTSPIAPHPNIHGTRIRWPELETGANSVAPCTRPRTIAWRMLTRSFRRRTVGPMLAVGRHRNGERLAGHEVPGSSHGDREGGEGGRERQPLRVGRGDEEHEPDSL